MLFLGKSQVLPSSPAKNIYEVQPFVHLQFFKMPGDAQKTELDK